MVHKPEIQNDQYQKSIQHQDIKENLSSDADKEEALTVAHFSFSYDSKMPFQNFLLNYCIYIISYFLYNVNWNYNTDTHFYKKLENFLYLLEYIVVREKTAQLCYI